MKLEAHGDRVIVRVIKDPEVSAGGVHLPENARERSQRGEVVAVGPGRWEYGVQVPVPFEDGDVILFSKYGGTELPEGGEKLLVLREADVLAIDRGYMEDHPDGDVAAGDAEPAELDPGATFHLDQLTEDTLAQLAVDVNAKSANPPRIICGSVRVERVARRIVASTTTMGPLYGMFDVALDDDLGADEWRLEPPVPAEADPS